MLNQLVWLSFYAIDTFLVVGGAYYIWKHHGVWEREQLHIRLWKQHFKENVQHEWIHYDGLGHQ